MAKYVMINGENVRVPKEKTILIKRVSKPEKAFFICMCVFCAVYAFSLVFPVFWLVTKSIEQAGLYDYNRRIYGWLSMQHIPSNMHFEQYYLAFSRLEYKGVNFAGMLMNSAWFVGIGTFQGIFWHATTAYIVSKYRFKGRNFLYNLVIVSAIVPVYGSGGSAYKLINDLGLYDKGPIYLILTTFGGLGGSFLTMVGLFKGISWEYAEAVYIDGGSDNTVYFRIMLPQAMPMLSALAVQTGVGLWNNYNGPLVYLPSTPTVATGLYQVQTGVVRQGMPIYFCGLVITLVPIMILYAFIAEKMMTNLSIGGLKG